MLPLASSAGPGIATTLSPDQVAKAWKAAQEFEAMSIGQLLQPMFATVESGPLGGGDGEEAWKPMFVDAIGKTIEAHGGIGLARPVFAEMLRAQESGGRLQGPTR